MMDNVRSSARATALRSSAERALHSQSSVSSTSKLLKIMSVMAFIQHGVHVGDDLHARQDHVCDDPVQLCDDPVQLKRM